jgi:two-component system NarL family sensor kinase
MPTNHTFTTLCKTMFLILLLLPSKLYSQKTATPDQVLDTKINRAKNLVYSDAKLSGKIADSVIVLSRQYNKPLVEATAWNIKGIVMSFIGTPDSALYYFEKMESLGVRTGDKKTLAKALQNKNLPLAKRGKYAEAFATCLQALKLYEELDYKEAQAGCLGDMGNIMIRSGKAAEGITYLRQALSVADQLNDDSLKPNFYNSLAVAYMDTEQFNEAKATYLKALPLAVKFNRLNNQISINLNLGDVTWELSQNPEDVMPYFNKAEKLAIEFGDDVKLSNIYLNIAVMLEKAGKLNEALDYALKSRSHALKAKDIYSEESVYVMLARLSKKAGNFKLAYETLELKDSISKIIFDKEARANMEELQAKYESEKKQAEITLLGKQNQIQSLQISKKNLQLGLGQLELAKRMLQINNQQLSISERDGKLKEKQMESTAKGQQIRLLDSQNKLQKLQLMERNILVGVSFGLLILLILIVLLLYNRYKARQEAKLHAQRIAQQEQAASAVIQAEENERNRIAGELHDGLGQLFSAVKMNLSGISDQLHFKDQHSKEMFDKTLEMVDESCKEVRVISHQMAPNVLLKSGLSAAIRDFISKIDARKLKINLETFGLQERLNQNTEAVLYRVVQESVNNVIKHSGASSLDIQLTKDEEGINAMIEDNGKGFDPQFNESSLGMGLKNIRSRVNYLKGTVDFSSEPGRGTLVAIHIPL